MFFCLCNDEPRQHTGMSPLQGGGHPVKDALAPLNLIDLLSFAPTLLEAFVPLAGLGLKTLGVDLRWTRIFRCAADSRALAYLAADDAVT